MEQSCAAIRNHAHNHHLPLSIVARAVIDGSLVTPTLDDPSAPSADVALHTERLET
jgi:hypothetical protein